MTVEQSSVLLCPPPKNRARRARTYFDDRSIQILEQAFLQEQYPDIHRREQLSNEIGTSEARVQVSHLVDYSVNDIDHILLGLVPE